MTKTERIVLSGALACALLLLLRATCRPAAAHLREPDVAPRIAVCAVMSITDELMESDRFRPARLEYEEELSAELLRPLLDRIKAVSEEAQGLKEDDPRLRELGERHRALQRQAQQATQQIAQKVEARVAEQLNECYALIRESAAGIAEQRGFNYVLASTDAGAALKSDTVMRLVRDVLARPVLVAPASVDLTEDVRADLNLD